MSRICSFAPFTSTGDGNVFQCTPSALTASRRRSVTQPPGCFSGYTAQYSPRDGIHCTSMCHANPSRSARDVVSGRVQCTPSTLRRSSTDVLMAPQPCAPELTLHISQSPAPRRTTLGDTIVWLGADTVSCGALHTTPSDERINQIWFSSFT